MAEVTETRDSGDGNRTGLHGMSASRTYHVRLDSTQTDDYTQALDNEDDPISPLVARLPPGTPHHVSGFSPLIVTDYEIVERHFERPSDYIVKVVYDHPLVPDNPSLEGWSIRITSATETAQMTRDLDGLWVGGHAYRVPETPEEGPPEPSTHYADTTNGRTALVQTAAVNPHPLDYFKAVSGMVITGTAYTLTANQMRDARSYVAKANSGLFYGSAPGHMLCLSVDVTARPADAQIEVQSDLKIAYDVTLEFIHSDEESFVYQYIWDFYEDDKGSEGPVYPNNSQSQVSRRFRVYRTANFYDLMRLFSSSGAINNLSGSTRVGGIRPIGP